MRRCCGGGSWGASVLLFRGRPIHTIVTLFLTAVRPFLARAPLLAPGTRRHWLAGDPSAFAPLCSSCCGQRLFRGLSLFSVLDVATSGLILLCIVFHVFPYPTTARGPTGGCFFLVFPTPPASPRYFAFVGGRRRAPCDRRSIGPTRQAGQTPRDWIGGRCPESSRFRGHFAFKGNKYYGTCSPGLFAAMHVLIKRQVTLRNTLHAASTSQHH